MPRERELSGGSEDLDTAGFDIIDEDRLAEGELGRQFLTRLVVEVSGVLDQPERIAVETVLIGEHPNHGNARLGYSHGLGHVVRKFQNVACLRYTIRRHVKLDRAERALAAG